MLQVIFRRDEIAALSFGASQLQIALIFPLRVLGDAQVSSFAVPRSRSSRHFGSYQFDVRRTARFGRILERTAGVNSAAKVDAGRTMQTRSRSTCSGPAYRFGGRRSWSLAPAKPSRRTNVRPGEMLPKTMRGLSCAASAVEGPLTVLRWHRNLHPHSRWAPACTAGVSHRLGDTGDRARCPPVAFRRKACGLVPISVRNANTNADADP